jgi:hypothetical protein
MNAAQRFFHRGACGGRKAIPDFSVTRGARGIGGDFRQALDIAGTKNSQNP